jgi:DNA-binding winged helix-turn-helix (wHTH) protein
LSVSAKFEVNLQSGELRRQGQKIRLQEQPFQVLAALLERPGELVTREELCTKLWPADTFVDFAHSLNAAIKRLRDALGEWAEAPVFIETMSRRGYRFVGGVAPEVRQAETTRSEIKRWGLRVAAAAMLLVAVLFLTGDVGGLRSKLLSRATTQPQIHSLAVLPLTNFSGDPEEEYFADAMTDALIGEPSRINSLKIISRTSVMQYRGEKRKSLPQIACVNSV